MSEANNSNQSGNGGGGVASGGGSGWGSKIGYIGVGIVIGIIAYPFVRRTLSQLQPKMDELFDTLTGKAENMAEKASDLFAKAKQGFAHPEKTEGASKPDPDHEHDHSNGGREV